MADNPTVSQGKLTARRAYFCGDCDDWKPGVNCPDCGGRCAVYVRPRPAGRAALTQEGE